MKRRFFNKKFKMMNVDYKKVESTDFYLSENYQEVMRRLENIQPNAERKWGTMTVDEMLHHLNLAFGSGLGYYTLPDVSDPQNRTAIKDYVLNVAKYFEPGTETAPTLKIDENKHYDFSTEKHLLKEILEKAYHTKSDEEWGTHTLFGEMTREDWGKLIMIHTNHHFQQFSN